MSTFGGPFFGFADWNGAGFGQWQSVAYQSQNDQAAKPTEKAEPNDPIDRLSTLLPFGRFGYFPGFDKAPPPGNWTWWQMRKFPAIVLASAVVTSPILAGTQTVEIVGNQDDAKLKKMKEWAEEYILPLVPLALAPAMECLHFGSWLTEVVWDRKDGYTVPCEFNSVLPGEAIWFRDQFRKFIGFQIEMNYRDARYAFHCVNQPYLDPIFGYSRNENCREEWWRARQSNLNADKLEKKASGIQMMVGIPMGTTFVDDKGNPIMPEDVVEKIVNAAAQGQVFSVPLTPFRKQDIIAKPELADIPAVKAQAFDWGNPGPALLAHLDRQDKLNRDIMRAWHRPEREAMEGEHGTKAEAGVHGEIGVTDSELVAAMILRQFSCQTFDRALVTNFGPDAAGKLCIKQSPLSDPQQSFLQQVALNLATDRATGPAFMDDINTRGLAERTELPLVSEEEAKAAKAKREQESPPQPTPRIAPAELEGDIPAVTADFAPRNAA